MRTSLTRFLARLAAVRVAKAKAKQDVVTTADHEVKTGGPSRLPPISNGGSMSSAGHKNKQDTHLLLDVRDPRVRFQNAVRAVIKLQRTTGKRATPVRPGLPRRDSWWQTSMTADPSTSASPAPDPGLLALRGARVTKVIEELKALKLMQELFPHGALVRHIQFSPNGKYLATSRWDPSVAYFGGCHLTDRVAFLFFLFLSVGIELQ